MFEQKQAESTQTGLIIPYDPETVASSGLKIRAGFVSPVQIMFPFICHGDNRRKTICLMIGYIAYRQTFEIGPE